MLGASIALCAAVFPFVENAGQVRAAETESVILAGGCFWCVESDFDTVNGVTATTSGYTGGSQNNPTYKSVTSGNSGHYEAVKIDFDPNVVSLRELVDKFWRSVDPTDPGGQFCDRGSSYRTAVFAADEGQRKDATASKKQAEEALGMRFATPILDATKFFPAEDYHQDYYLGTNASSPDSELSNNPKRISVIGKLADGMREVKQLWGRSSGIRPLNRINRCENAIKQILKHSTGRFTFGRHLSKKCGRPPGRNLPSIGFPFRILFPDGAQLE